MYNVRVHEYDMALHCTNKTSYHTSTTYLLAIAIASASVCVCHLLEYSCTRNK